MLIKFWPYMLMSPDEPAGGKPAETTDTVAGGTSNDTVAETEVVDTLAAGEGNDIVVDDAAEDKPVADKAKPAWWERRLGKTTAERNALAAENARLISENATLKAKPAETTEAAETVTTTRPDLAPGTAAFNAAVQMEAGRLAAERTFNDTCNRVFDDGTKKFPDFEQSVQQLKLVGAEENPAFYEAAVSLNQAPTVLHHLGKNPDEAARILAMPPMRMAQELARLEGKLLSNAPRTVSKAPKPITPIDGGTLRSGDTEPSDEDDMKTWLAKRDATARRKFRNASA